MLERSIHFSWKWPCSAEYMFGIWPYIQLSHLSYSNISRELYTSASLPLVTLSISSSFPGWPDKLTATSTRSSRLSLSPDTSETELNHRQVFCKPGTGIGSVIDENLNEKMWYPPPHTHTTHTFIVLKTSLLFQIFKEILWLYWLCYWNVKVYLHKSTRWIFEE